MELGFYADFGNGGDIGGEIVSGGEEINRIKKAYLNYSQRKISQKKWSVINPGNQLIWQECKNKMKEILEDHGFFPLSHHRILDIGCGSGRVLETFRQWGSSPNNLYGVDLRNECIEKGKREFPEFTFLIGNAEYLNFQDHTFDLVLVFTVFSSILDNQMSFSIAKEIDRVLINNGAVLWYDFRFDNPKNLNVRGMTIKNIQLFFPKFNIYPFKITVLPPLARRLGRYTHIIYPKLAAIPFLLTHYLCLLKKP
jgi:ubiquinone/menaquinone biosynthesis C-methylase UbiE